ncbi:MAG TPA: VRR-NUC domain-containing protein [Deltaproteobacteria bacterium]|jgi:hypothetical protein|nr:VRR-NUC domain-containing protein [Deltaproteobacteria bacterium]HQM21569.1 VRR-NUC domain-containing protein [Deltaproteobacteria bacterium]
MIPLREHDIQKQILEYLARRRIFAWRQNSGAVVYEDRNRDKRFVRFASVNGISDILGILPDGRLLAIEVKKKGGKPSLEQQVFMEAIQENNGIAIVAYSLDDVVQILERSRSHERQGRVSKRV